eukprot:NODE_2612_length_500_cov_228.800443_g2075_i0.p3 GENE.NODE_2612_length_500_cov_228.800443_g2075_i0~~NODE_2612_length_500_cov_228.800443_g2075_i0.p3  ORF type:complete len:100 (-),score=22.16 NODE_2612_length_500_cov_228.800443_g2075_i0:141-440(-)
MPTPYDNALVTYDDVDWEKIPNRYKYRPMPLSEVQMDELKIPYKYRDYCVDKFANMFKCHEMTAYNRRCHTFDNEWDQCKLMEALRRREIKVLREELGR